MVTILINDGYAPDLITKLGWEVKFRWIQEEELSEICVGSFII